MYQFNFNFNKKGWIVNTTLKIEIDFLLVNTEQAVSSCLHRPVIAYKYASPGIYWIFDCRG